LVAYALEKGHIDETQFDDIETGKNAYYHAGGEFLSKKKELLFFRKFYNFFLLLLILPRSFGAILFKIRAYKYTHLIPSIFLVIVKELILPLFSNQKRESPIIRTYIKYYLMNMKTFITGHYR
jgi:hypothetical protein